MIILTTFVGLAPMISETAVQAQFLIPLAVCIGFGILIVTAIILILIPACLARHPRYPCTALGIAKIRTNVWKADGSFSQRAS